MRHRHGFWARISTLNKMSRLLRMCAVRHNQLMVQRIINISGKKMFSEQKKNKIPSKNSKIRNMKSMFLDITKNMFQQIYIMCASPCLQTKLSELCSNSKNIWSSVWYSIKNSAFIWRLGVLLRATVRSFWEGRRDSCESCQHFAQHHWRKAPMTHKWPWRLRTVISPINRSWLTIHYSKYSANISVY